MEGPYSQCQQGSSSLQSHREKLDSLTKILEKNRIKFFQETSQCVPEKDKLNMVESTSNIKRNLLILFDAVQSSQSLNETNYPGNQANKNPKIDGHANRNHLMLPPRLKPTNSTPAMQNMQEKDKNTQLIQKNSARGLGANFLPDSQSLQMYINMKNKLAECQKPVKKANYGDKESDEVCTKTFDERRRTESDVSFIRAQMDSSFDRQSHKKPVNNALNTPLNVAKPLICPRKCANEKAKGTFNPLSSNQDLNLSKNKENITLNNVNNGHFLHNHFPPSLKPRPKSRDLQSNSRDSIPRSNLMKEKGKYDVQCPKRRDYSHNLSRESNNNKSRDTLLNRSRENIRQNGVNIYKGEANREKSLSRHGQDSGKSENLPAPLALIRNESNERGCRDPSPVSIARPHSKSKKTGSHSRQNAGYYQVNLSKEEKILKRNSFEHSFNGGAYQYRSLGSDQAQMMRYVQPYHSTANVLKDITANDLYAHGPKAPNNGLMQVLGGVSGRYQSQKMRYIRDSSFYLYQ